METFFNREAKKHRPTVQVIMIAKYFQIENAILETFTANSSFKYKKAHFKDPLDLESQF